MLSGCVREEEAIRIGEEPKPIALATTPDPVDGKVRLLGAIIPQPEENWFVKMRGPSADVAGAEKQFRAFVESVKLTGKEDDPVTWTLPQGWEREKSIEDRLTFRAFRFGPKEKPLDVTISRAGGALLDNLNRWRGQVGLKTMWKFSELPRVTHTVDMNGLKVVLVDMSGPGSTGRMPMIPGHPH